jgi:hypothetical protein
MKNNVFLQVKKLDFTPIEWKLLHNDKKLKIEIERLNKQSKNLLNF